MAGSPQDQPCGKVGWALAWQPGDVGDVGRYLDSASHQLGDPLMSATSHVSQSLKDASDRNQPV